jgi:hypothetical protein
MEAIAHISFVHSILPTDLKPGMKVWLRHGYYTVKSVGDIEGAVTILNLEESDKAVSRANGIPVSVQVKIKFDDVKSDLLVRLTKSLNMILFADWDPEGNPVGAGKDLLGPLYDQDLPVHEELWGEAYTMLKENGLLNFKTPEELTEHFGLDPDNDREVSDVLHYMSMESMGHGVSLDGNYNNLRNFDGFKPCIEPDAQYYVTQEQYEEAYGL